MRTMALKKRIDSFRYAIRGLLVFFSQEVHAKFHLITAIVTIGLGFLFHINTTEWIAVLFCIGAVIGLEALNSALETLTDLVSPDYHPLAGKAKDLAAGAVLWMAVCAAIIGLLIFVPKFVLIF